MSDTGQQDRKDDATIEREAAEWFARLIDDERPESHEVFRQWLVADERHGRAFGAFERLWTGAGVASAVGGRLTRRNALKGGAAVLLAGAGLGVTRLFWPASDHSTGIGETAIRTLADGSRVQLSPQTALSVDFSDTHRRVRLDKGEAYFEVAADPGRPFSVRARGVSATALGTEYAVANRDDRVSVLVTRHAVNVEAGGQSRRVEEGESVSWQAGRLAVPMAADTETELAWRSGRLVFLATPLSTVIEDIGRWRRGKIVIMSEELARRPVTLIVDVNRSETILDTLAFGLPIKITQVSPLLAFITPR